MLTLSATPIPRTLNMAMSGIRDLSTIEQPPFERQPVETFVLEYNDVILAEATHFADDLKALGLTAAVFPPRDFMLRPVEGAGREYEYRRLSVLGALAGGRLNAVCVPAEALLQYTVPRDEFLRNTLTLKPGMVYNREALVARLFAAGYVRRSQVDGPGQFSVRGDIVDIYAPDMHQPARVEYWDDEIDSCLLYTSDLSQSSFALFHGTGADHLADSLDAVSYTHLIRAGNTICILHKETLRHLTGVPLHQLQQLLHLFHPGGPAGGKMCIRDSYGTL